MFDSFDNHYIEYYYGNITAKRYRALYKYGNLIKYVISAERGYYTERH